MIRISNYKPIAYRKSFLFSAVLLIPILFTHDIIAQENIPYAGNNHLSAGFDYSFFNDQTQPWKLFALESKLKVGNNTFLPRIDLAQRFGKNGISLEHDFYRSLKNKDYFLINGAIGTTPVFAKYKLGIEYFNPFGKSWEMSAGAKYLQFANGVDILLINTSLSKYYGNHLTIVRPLIAIQNFNKQINNFTLSAQQRYYRKEQEYLSLNLSWGYDPGIQLFNDVNTLTAENISLLTFGISSSHQLSARWKLLIMADHNRWDINGRIRNQNGMSFRLQYRFD